MSDPFTDVVHLPARLFHFFFVDGQRHGPMAGDLAEGVVGVKEYHRLLVHLDFNGSFKLHDAGFEPFHIRFKPYYPVRLNPTKFGADQGLSQNG